MQHYKHILFATDLSDESYKIAAKARAISEACKADFSLVHVFMFNPMNYAAGEFSFSLEADVKNNLLTKARENLAKQGKKLGVSEASQWLETGFPSATIAELASKHQVDLIIVGSHDKNGLALILGSTANSLFHNMQCDVLAVHAE